MFSIDPNRAFSSGVCPARSHFAAMYCKIALVCTIFMPSICNRGSALKVNLPSTIKRNNLFLRYLLKKCYRFYLDYLNFIKPVPRYAKHVLWPRQKRFSLIFLSTISYKNLGSTTREIVTIDGLQKFLALFVIDLFKLKKNIINDDKIVKIQ